MSLFQDELLAKTIFYCQTHIVTGLCTAQQLPVFLYAGGKLIEDLTALEREHGACRSRLLNIRKHLCIYGYACMFP